MKHIILLIVIGLSALSINGQNEAFAKNFIEIIKTENYHEFDDLFQPIEQQRKILHWTKSEKTGRMLMVLRDSLKLALIESAKTLRASLEQKGLDPNRIKFTKCQVNDNSEIVIHFSEKNRKDSLRINTIKTDKIYVMLPIDHEPIKLPVFNQEIEGAESTIIISGKKFKSLDPSEKEKDLGLNILKKCLEDDSINEKNSMCVGGMKNDDNTIFLSYVLIDNKTAKRYLIDLKNETCKEK